MQLQLVNRVPKLCIGPDSAITFRKSWIEDLFKLQYEKYGEYIRSVIYPLLTDGDRKWWNKTTINNKVI